MFPQTIGSIWAGLASNGGGPGQMSPSTTSSPGRAPSENPFGRLMRFAQELGNDPEIQTALANAGGAVKNYCDSMSAQGTQALFHVHADSDSPSSGPPVDEQEWARMTTMAQRGDMQAVQWVMQNKGRAPVQRPNNAMGRRNRERLRRPSRAHPVKGTGRLLDKPVAQKMQELLPWCDSQAIFSALNMFASNADKAMDYLLDNRLSDLAKTMRPNNVPQPTHVDPGKTFLGNFNPNVNPEDELRRADTIAAVPAPVVADVNETMADNGTRRALLIGINYIGTSNELKGCIEDTKNIRTLLTGLFGFPDTAEHITVLTDDQANPVLRPTRKNILLGIKWLVGGATAGSVLFFHFSGHGSQKRNLLGTETDGYDETIMPLDYKATGDIIDDELYTAMIKPLPAGCKLVCLMDCCHSGSGLDLPYIYKEGVWNLDAYPKFAAADVQLISGCQDHQTSADFYIPQKESGGAMTKALRQALARNPTLTYAELMANIRNFLDGWGFDQLPQLSSSQRFSVERKFALNEILQNSNPVIGKLAGITSRRALPPPPPPMSHQISSRGRMQPAMMGMQPGTGGMVGGMMEGRVGMQPGMPIMQPGMPIMQPGMPIMQPGMPGSMVMQPGMPMMQRGMSGSMMQPGIMVQQHQQQQEDGKHSYYQQQHHQQQHQQHHQQQHGMRPGMSGTAHPARSPFW